MIFHSSLRKELARSFGATCIVLVTVVMTMTLIRTLGQASRGSFNPSDVTLVMGYTVLAYLPTLLTMSLFIAIIATLSRMYRESEMVIWLCSGSGLAHVLPALMRFAWPIFAVVTALALLVLPWTNQRIEELKNQYEKRGDVERIEPGQFQESANGARVFFVEGNHGAENSGTNVFIAATENNKQTITLARRGRIEARAQGRFLLLNDGQRLEIASDNSDLKISEFQQYGIALSLQPSGAGDYIPVNTVPTLTLLRQLTPSHLAELSWRLGLLFAAVNFVVIGVAASGVNPRVGRSVNLIFSLTIFVLYYNLLNLGQSWIAAGKFSFSGFMLSLHAGVLLAACLWLAKIHANWQWRHLVARPARSARPVPAR